jgi:hypothetical protein
LISVIVTTISTGLSSISLIVNVHLSVTHFTKSDTSYINNHHDIVHVHLCPFSFTIAVNLSALQAHSFALEDVFQLAVFHANKDIVNDDAVGLVSVQTYFTDHDI